MQPRFGVGKPDLDLVVEAAGTPEGGIECARSIGGGYYADSAQVTQPVHEGEELRDEGGLEALAHHVARGGEGVYLIEEDDRRRFGARLVEDRTQLRLALTPELVEDLRPGDGHEVGPALVGDGAGEKGLTRARRPVEEDPLVRPDVEPAEYLGVGYGQLHRLADQVYGLAHPADVLVAGRRHVAAAGRRAARRGDARSPTAHAPREAFDEALPVLLRGGLFASVARLDHLPARKFSFLPVAPGGVPAGVYPLGEAGHDLGGRVEVQNRAPDARAEVREYALGDGVLVHPEGGPLVHLAESVPGVIGEMVVVVDPDLTARKKLLVREGRGRAPLPRRPPGALLAQKTPQAPEELFRRERSPVGRVLGVVLAAQEPGEVI